MVEKHERKGGKEKEEGIQIPWN